METITWDEFAKIELRVGRVVSAKPFPEARKPAHIIEVDFRAELSGGISPSTRQVLNDPFDHRLIG